MSNEIQLSQDINVITAEINSYKNVAGQAIYEIGIRLKWVKEKDLTKGEFWQWAKNNCDFDASTATRLIQVVDQFGLATSQVSTSKLFEMLTLPKNIDRQEFIQQSHNVPSTGETKTVDEMTVRELREVKRSLKEKEEEIRQLERDKNKLSSELNQEKIKPVKVETKYIEKEIDNTDYDKINQLQRELDQNKNKLHTIENQKNVLEQKVKLEEEDAAEYRKLKEEVKRLHSEKDDLHRQIESATSISALYVDIEDLLQNKLAPMKYSRALTERRDSEVAMRNLKEIIEMVDTWSSEMKTYLPNYNKNIIDAEVVDYE